MDQSPNLLGQDRSALAAAAVFEHQLHLTGSLYQLLFWFRSSTFETTCMIDGAFDRCTRSASQRFNINWLSGNVIIMVEEYRNGKLFPHSLTDTAGRSNFVELEPVQMSIRLIVKWRKEQYEVICEPNETFGQLKEKVPTCSPVPSLSVLMSSAASAFL